MAIDVGARRGTAPSMGFDQQGRDPSGANRKQGRGDERFLALANYLKDVQEGRGEDKLAQLASSGTYAEAFWDIYKRGMIMRERLVQDIYLVQEQQKFYPNPFDDIAFSHLRQVRTAAQLLGLVVLDGERVSQAHIDYMERWVKANEPARQTPVLAWLITPGNGDVPMLCLWPANPNWSEQIAFAGAAVLGYYEVLGGTMNGVGSVTDLVVPPCHRRDRIWTPLLHNYARALLHLPMHCPAINRCHCNTVLTQLRPDLPNHPLPTGSLDQLANRTPVYEPMQPRPTAGPAPTGRPASYGAYGGASPSTRPATPSRPTMRPAPTPPAGAMPVYPGQPPFAQAQYGTPAPASRPVTLPPQMQGPQSQPNPYGAFAAAGYGTPAPVSRPAPRPSQPVAFAPPAPADAMDMATRPVPRADASAPRGPAAPPASNQPPNYGG